MKVLLLMLTHFITTLAKLLEPGGAKAIVADIYPDRSQLNGDTGGHELDDFEVDTDQLDLFDLNDEILF